MSADEARRREHGFTLPELLVAITILGIIMAAIGAMITTAFRTTATVGDRLNASRGPKMVSRYWQPDVERAVTIDTTGACGSGTGVVASFVWSASPSTIGPEVVDPPAGVEHTATWWYQNGPRQQLVRQECAPGETMESATIVADLDGPPTVVFPSDGERIATIDVTVPDSSQPDKTFSFSVGGAQMVTE